MCYYIRINIQDNAIWNKILDALLCIFICFPAQEFYFVIIEMLGYRIYRGIH